MLLTICCINRCWAYETSVLLNENIGEDIPYNDFFEYYAPDFKLHLTPTSMENKNTIDSLQVYLSTYYIYILHMYMNRYLYILNCDIISSASL